MITGVEILEVNEITTIPKWIMIFVAIAIICAFLAVFFAGKSDIYGIMQDVNKARKFRNIAFISLSIFIISFIIFFVLAYTINIPTGEYNYTISLNGIVDIDSIYEQYEVIETNGKIWTVKDK